MSQQAILDALLTVLDEEHARAVIDYRLSKATVKPFDVYRAKLTANRFAKSLDCRATFYEIVHGDANKKELTVEFVRAVLHYDQATGAFTRRSTGKRCETRHAQGYRTVSVAANKHLAHRLAWFYVTGSWPADQIDHINRCRKDNSFANLRECSNQQNCWNMNRSVGKSGVRGVHWDCKRRKWVATIRVAGKTAYLGQFDDKQIAATAYRSAEAQHRGNFLEVSQ